MTPADTALALLRESRDGTLIWHDNGAPNWTRRGRGRRSTWGCTATRRPQRCTAPQRQKIGGRRGGTGARV